MATRWNSPAKKLPALRVSSTVPMTPTMKRNGPPRRKEGIPTAMRSS
jgi:hypothetical protein